MATSEEYFEENDFDVSDFLAVDEDIVLNNDEITSVISTSIESIPLEQNEKVFQCENCTKVYLSKRGLTRHQKNKHGDSGSAQLSVNDRSLEKLHPLYFKKLLNETVSKLANDKCYPDKTREEFNNANFASLNDDVLPIYSIFKTVISHYDGNNAKFYTSFYKEVKQHSEEPSKFKMSKKSNILLGFELANFVLAHLSGGLLKGDLVSYDENQIEKDIENLPEKEISIINYLAGYVFATFYRRIRYSEGSSSSVYHQQCLKVLLAGKIKEECNIGSDVNLKLVTALDRGGLWKVNKNVCHIFSVTEIIVQNTLSHVVHHCLDSKNIVFNLLQNPLIRYDYSKIIDECREPISNEISFNLLDDLLTLYIRVRIFSYAKEVKTAHSIRKNQTKLKSLRKEMKKLPSNIDQ